MKFKVKAKPNYCDKKTVVRFAWFPNRIDNTIVWLEKYECTYICLDSICGDLYWSIFDKKLINKDNGRNNNL